MSAATSPGTGLAYGLRRVCAAWGMGQQATLVTANKLVHCLFGVGGGTGFPHRL